MATSRLKSWFTQVTATVSTIGSRFRTGDKPKQSTFEDLMVSVPFKKEASDKAKEGSTTAELSTVVGLVQAASDAQVAARQTPLSDRTLVVQPHQIPLPPSVTDTDYAYVLYNELSPEEGTGSITSPFTSLAYALSELSSNSKSLIILDSGTPEFLPSNTFYDWDKNIHLSGNATIKASVSSYSTSGNPPMYLFNANVGFSITGTGSIVLLGIGLVALPESVDSVATNYKISDICIYGTTALFKTKKRAIFIIDNVGLKHYDNGSVYSRYPVTYNAFSDSSNVSQLFSTDSKFSQVQIKGCDIQNYVISVDNSVMIAASLICDSKFYANKDIPSVSYITLNSLYSYEYNLTSRNNTYDLGGSVERAAFTVNSNNAVSVNDRIVRYSSGKDMLGSFAMLFLNTVVQTTNHDSVITTGSSFITCPAGYQVQ